MSVPVGSASDRAGLTVAVAGCGLIGRKRAQVLGPDDRLIGATDPVSARADELAGAHGGRACSDLDELLELGAEVVVVATTHDQLAPLTQRALEAGSHVLVEKPAALGTGQVESLLRAAEQAGRRVKVGFNHRFHPALRDLAGEVHSGVHGPLMHLRGRYGHGGRLGYEEEWRAQPQRSGGGELIDQGMHLLDLTHWLAGPLPLHSALLRTQFWNTPVEDNAALLLGEPHGRTAPWASLHVTWTEWKNLFSVEVYCTTAKLQVDGLVRSYGPQTLRIYRMSPEMGPPELEERSYGADDLSWAAEWEHFAAALGSGARLLGDLHDAHYVWAQIEAAYASSPDYSEMRAGVGV
ncbi:MAG TPA: Gfo/Idh/MocA family oxidoreductase [Candidatus Methylomirabilis sp.]|nr:Gfo/Idh/MocA family oxidoreductase [Candidatus Methylomirabilis sp.]